MTTRSVSPDRPSCSGCPGCQPAGVPDRDFKQLPLAVDELEAIRLVDLEGLSHEQAASAMGVSRQPVGRVLERGRVKVAEALVGGKAILIGGGQYRVEPRLLCCTSCGAVWAADPEALPPTQCPSCAAPGVGTCWDPVGGCGMGRRGHRGGQGFGAADAGCQGRGRGRGGSRP